MKTVVQDISEVTPAVSSVVLAISQNKAPVIVGAAAILFTSIFLLVMTLQPSDEGVQEGTVAEQEESETGARVQGDEEQEIREQETADSDGKEEVGFEMTVELNSEPTAVVFVKGVGDDEDMEKLGTTPVDLTFTHEAEARRLVYRPEDEQYRRIYPDMEVTIFAADFAKKHAEEESLEHFVKLKCADLTDPDCNDYLDRFNKVFEEDE